MPPMPFSALPSPALYLIDSMSIVFQAFYAVRGFTNAQGMPTNSIFGFVRKIQKLLATQRPTHLLAVFDSPGPNFRHAIYEAYKANRQEQPEEFHVQIPWIFKTLEAMHIPYVFRDGFEADDLIGTMSKTAPAQGLPVIILSADKDLFQLVTPEVTLLRTTKDDLVPFGPDEVFEKLGVRPDQMVDYLALMGDASDNIPGVPKIGPKTAEALLKQFGTLDNLLANVDQVTSKTQRALLQEHRDKALLSRRLAAIACDVPLDLHVDELVCHPQMESPELLELYRELGFLSLIKEARERQARNLVQQEEAPRAKVKPVVVQRGDAVQEDMFGSMQPDESAVARGATPETQVVVVQDAATLHAVAKRLHAAKRFAFDTETTSVDSMQAALVGISLSVEKGHAWYIPVGHKLEQDRKRQLPLEDVCAALNPLFTDPRITRVAHNAKYDIRILRRHGFTVAETQFDTMLASYLLNPGGRHGLKALAFQHFHVEMTEIDELIGKGKTAITMDRVAIDHAAPYAGADADLTLQLADLFAPCLETEGLLPLFRDIEMPLLEVLDAMEFEGIRVDTDLLKHSEKDFERRLEAIALDIYREAGREFNISSPKQVGEVLFGDLGLKPKRKGAKADSTSSEILEELAEEHPLPRRILDYRHLDKLLSTYVLALPKMVHPETGRIHASFNQFIAATGRLSSSDPNLQNIPIRSAEGREIRRAFVPNQPGEVLLAADYSQIELRILAHFTGDVALQQA
ncbi:TPA: DNA polymerase I, partial [Candidatus Sumerlaeota bacterium]|nr:DNA polymerase I [Candidatus Sumerlaeota bacterium]